jgi:hypothetical protein
MTLFSRVRREQEMDAVFADAASLEAVLGDVEVPDDIAKWLGRLLTLNGVPFGYLVGDEGELPTESIRFFHLDDNWIRALIDGAFSLGRNLTATAESQSMNLDRAMFPKVVSAARVAAPVRRRSSPLAAEPEPIEKPWTGFVLRSRVVTAFPGLGVNAYEEGHTPDDDAPVLLPIRRLDRLGPDADTLLCLIEGDAYRVDVHEAPELLHFGVDDYESHPGAAPTATKELHKFRRAEDGSVTILKKTVPVAVGASFRTRSPRVASLALLAAELAQANNKPDEELAQLGQSELDSAEMGFAMTEGVGMVSFLRRPT